MIKLFILAVSLFIISNGEETELAQTPPMGWLSWVAFTCTTDCVLHPEHCVSERLYKEMAEKLISDGYAAAGYNHVNIDDCWASKKRDAQGRLQADPKRFPNGIKHLADFMHEKGLKLGIYADVGNATCAGYPGSMHHLQQDAQTFADWGVDMLKFDGCNADLKWVNYAYPAMAKFLKQTGRPILYSCEWTLNQQIRHAKPNFTEAAKYCNMDRNFDDIGKSWGSLMRTVEFYDRHQQQLIPTNGPGHWHDPDMVLVGNLEFTLDQSKAQLGLWAMWSAPLLMSNDLRIVDSARRELLLNKDVIAIDQDPMGKMATMIANSTYVAAYVKQILPRDTKSGEYSCAILFLNRNVNSDMKVSAELSRMGLRNGGGYIVKNVFSGASHGHMKPSDTFSGVVPRTGVIMLRATVINE